jgi:DNA-binding MarR family transcriptional regulator
MAVLALVVQQPDTRSKVAARLAQEFAHAGWSRSAAYGNLDSLERQGLVRKAAHGGRASCVLYEVTVKGAAVSARWVCGSDAKLPVARDVVHGRLRFSAPEVLPAIIEALRAEQEHCAKEYGRAHGEAAQARWSPVSRREHAPGCGAEIARFLIADEAAFWGALAQRRQRLREQLENLLEESRASPVQPRPRG